MRHLGVVSRDTQALLERGRCWTLADADVNIEMISTSEVRITCMIAEADLETALRALHDAFELERPETIDADVSAAG